MQVRLKPPASVIEKEKAEADRVKKFLRSRKLNLSPEKVTRIEQDLDKKFVSWNKGTKALRDRLVRWQELLEGIVEKTNMPFEGASNITIHYAAGMARTFRATFNKTLYQDANIFMPVVAPDFEITAEDHMALEEGFNHSFSTAYNGIEILKEGTIPVLRDGVLVISGSWEREVEKCFEYKSYADYTGFMKDYPDAETAGVDDEKFKGIQDHFITEPDEEVEVIYEHDFVKFDGIKYAIDSLAKFVRFPVFSKCIPDMTLYGNLSSISKEDLKMAGKRKKYYADAIERVLDKKMDSTIDAWEKSAAWISGVNVSQDDNKPIKILKGVYKTDLDGDGVPAKYMVTYAPDTKVLLAIEPYSIRRNQDLAVAFRLISRENRFEGVSLVGDTEDLFNQIDVLHRHRNNVRMLVTSPVFIGNATYKDQIDLGRGDNVIRPGLTLWVMGADFKSAIQQLPIQNLDQPGNSIDEEQFLTRHVELAWGPTQGLSGQQTAEDPRSPARKTQMLMTAANARVDDYIDEFAFSLPELAKLHATLLFQYYGDKEYTFDQNNTVKKFPIDLLANPGIKWMAKRRSVNLTPEFAMARLANLTQLYMGLLPRMMVGDPIAIEMWNRQLVNSGEPDARKLIWTEQNGKMALANQQAMQQQAMQMQVKNKSDIKAETSFKGAIGKHVGEAVGKMFSGPDMGPQGKNP